jgi:YegS/Rv2252/BmrU family lipid kinase
MMNDKFIIHHSSFIIQMLNEIWLLIANPTSGGGKLRQNQTKIEQILNILNIPYVLRLTQKGGDATRFAQEGIAAGHRKIMAIGGDGTGNEVINGIFKQKWVSPSEITYTLMPVGTGNDWVRNLNLPKTIESFFEMIQRGNTTWQDIGIIRYTKKDSNQVLIHEHFFANAGGAGYDAAVVHSVEFSKRILTKKISYFWHILKCLNRYDAPLVRLTFDGQTITDRFYTINFGIHRYSGAGMQLTPHAIADDGLLALTLIRDLPRVTVALNTPKLYLGTVAKLQPYTTLHQVKKIQIESLDAPLLVETDGEFLGQTPIEITILHKALKICKP